MGAAAEHLSQVRGQHAHVGPGRAIDLDAKHPGLVVGRGVDVEPCHGDGAGGPLDLDPGPGQLVQAPPTHLARRDHGRDLVHDTGERCRRLAHLVEGDPGHVPGPGDLARGIEGAGGAPEHDLGLVGLRETR